MVYCDIDTRSFKVVYILANDIELIEIFDSCSLN